VRQALPSDAALVEFVWYRPLNIKAKKEADRFDVPRYAAYVLRREGDPGFIDLGQAPLIELVLFRLRAALRNPQRNDVKQLARLLDKSLMEPVRRLLGSERRIFLSPDGALNLLPFGALVDEQERYLVERYGFTYVTSGRDLLRMNNHFTGNQPPMVMANPLFDAAITDNVAVTDERQQTQRSSGGLQLNLTSLKGTEEEARQIGKLLNVTPLTGVSATEGALKRASSPRILHIATHGYFHAYQEPEPTRAEGFDPFRSLSQFRAVEESKSPLLRSGLAFTGANRPARGGSEDGILTALEAAGLNLWGTKLVVLSACETGLGDVQIGEGVYGLRRSFMLAGAESAVMSFWKVEDEVTRDLMVQYYKRLLDGEGRSDALRQVQLKILGNAAQGHPYYWASFIHLGNWQGLTDPKPVLR
jgi:CHAT domain-containing protein